MVRLVLPTLIVSEMAMPVELMASPKLPAKLTLSMDSLTETAMSAASPEEVRTRTPLPSVMDTRFPLLPLNCMATLVAEMIVSAGLLPAASRRVNVKLPLSFWLSTWMLPLIATESVVPLKKSVRSSPAASESARSETAPVGNGVATRIRPLGV